MNFGDSFKKGIEIIKLNRKVISEISKNKDAMLMAVLFYAISGIAASLTAGPVAWIGGAVGAVIGSFIGIGILHIIAKIFGGKAGFSGFYKPMGIGSLLSWVPFLGPVLSLWNIVVSVVILEEVHKLSRGKAILVVLIPVIIVTIIALVLMITAVAFLATMFGVSGMEFPLMQ
ncbi:YIP1 family protein [Candidatus Woesearchaeota archaeon]|nr:YIP1 family protein [Candidatus Woesearchaeota archaeon]